MISARRLVANKQNATLSTGPRTQAGKLRSRANAHRHGLATQLSDDPDERSKIECLAVVLTDGCDHISLGAQARIIAECYFDLRRIRNARHGTFLKMGRTESYIDLESAVSEITKIDRYAQRTLSKRKTALRNLFSGCSEA